MARSKPQLVSVRLVRRGHLLVASSAKRVGTLRAVEVEHTRRELRARRGRR